MSEILVLWLATTPVGVEIPEAHRDRMRLVQCSMRDVVRLAIASGAVIAVVDDDRAATEVLGAGVDEVIRQGDLTDAELARAAERAETRARARLRSLSLGHPADEAEAMATLLDWVAIELVACVSGAVLEGELLEESVRRLLARRDLGLPFGESVPSSADTLEMLETVRESFERMQEVLQSVRALSRTDGSAGTWLGPICEALARMVRNRAVPLADVELQLDPGCVTSIRSAKLVGVLVTLLGHLFECAVRDGGSHPRKRARITLRTFVVGDAAILEIEDDLVGGREHETRIQRPDPIAEVKKRLRGEGGEVHVASAPGGTTVRLVLPLHETASVPELEAPARAVPSSRVN